MGNEGTIWSFISLIKCHKMTKNCTVLSSSIKVTKNGQNRDGLDGEQQVSIFCFRERNFSLKIRRIRPSAGFGTGRRNALRRKGYAWVPDLGSFFKLLEVGFPPTWVLFPFLVLFKCLS